MNKLLIANIIKCVNEGHHITEGRHIYTLAIDSDDVLNKPYIGDEWRPIYGPLEKINLSGQEDACLQNVP